jgi:cytochrome c553
LQFEQGQNVRLFSLKWFVLVQRPLKTCLCYFTHFLFFAFLGIVGSFLEITLGFQLNFSPNAQADTEIAQLYQQKCASCHGQKGEGTTSLDSVESQSTSKSPSGLVPKIRGQHAWYLESSFHNFGKDRKLFAQEHKSLNLSDDQIKKISEYISQIRADI